MQKLKCATLDAGGVVAVDIEVSFLKALPGFSIVGLAGNSIQEAKERVKSALLTSGFTFPPKKILVNLSPSDQKKSGSHFDLGIAMAIGAKEVKEIYVFGELGLDGKVKDSSLIFPILLALAKEPIEAIVPKESLPKLCKIPNLTLYGVEHLQEALNFFIHPQKPAKIQQIDAKEVTIKGKCYYYLSDYPLDFKDVKGQSHALRAALIAAAGWHNLLLEGSPGCGKSMIAKRLPYILPPMSLEEVLEVAKNEALEGREPTFTAHRPLRSPHHSATKASIFGGGSGEARPGEVAYANKGVLFFDEFPHFSKSVLEALREPLQNREVHISRVHSKVIYESDFLFVAAQNPCPCGNMLSTSKECRCNELEIERYRNKISEPLLDRIELYVQMGETTFNDTPTTSSAAMHKRVIEAFTKQIERQGKLNGKLSEGEIERYCQMEPEALSILEQAISRFGLSQRSVANLKKVSRTIADLDGRERIEKEHMLEALRYRRRV